MGTFKPSFQVGSLRVHINMGELLFPLLVLCFCAAYYFDSRNLPDESMLYAGPLLYATAAMAVVTVGGQAVSVDRSKDSSKIEKNSGRGSMMGWSSEKGTNSQITALAIGLIVTSYISSLYVVSFTAATPIFLAGSLYILGERSIIRLTAYSAGFTTAVWLVFVKWLLVPLP